MSFSTLLHSMEVRYASLLATMDNLWFYQIILFDEPISAIYSKPVVQSSNLMQVSDHSEEDIVSTDSFTSSTTSQDDHVNELEEEKALERTISQRPTILSVMSNKSQSKSPFPSKHRRPRKSLSYPIDKTHKLQRFLNCKILHDLEQVELRGFLDLGFEFEKDRLSPRTMNTIPGLQRLVEQATINVNDQNQATFTLLDGKEDEVEKEKRVVKKPYLSDAWLMKKTDSPLLRLRMARVSTAQEMKECLKLWARTVASSIHSVQ